MIDNLSRGIASGFSYHESRDPKLRSLAQYIHPDWQTGVATTAPDVWVLWVLVQIPTFCIAVWWLVYGVRPSLNLGGSSLGHVDVLPITWREFQLLQSGGPQSQLWYLVIAQWVASVASLWGEQCSFLLEGIT